MRPFQPQIRLHLEFLRPIGIQRAKHRIIVDTEDDLDARMQGQRVGCDLAHGGPHVVAVNAVMIVS
jgi:hypothetical protein